jgi:type II secretory ATPase GspE/PulE/Tfp pilus assembly ATPase PilB-like protein
MAISDEIRQCVVDGLPPSAAREIAMQQGMRTLQQEAIQMVERDVTTMEEVVKHVIMGEELA